MMNTQLREQLSELRKEIMPEPQVEEQEEPLQVEASSPLGEEEQETEPQTTEELIEYFNELPEVLDIDPEQFYKLKLKTDSGDTYTWSEIKDTLQQHKQRMADLENKEHTLTQREQELLSKLQAAPAVSEEVMKAQTNVQAIAQAYNLTLAQLDQLQAEDDTAGLVRAQTELTKLQGMYTQATQQLQQAYTKQQQEQQQIYAEYRNKQLNEVKRVIPEFDKVKGDLKQYLLDSNFKQDEVSQLVDARLALLSYKAMQWDKHQKSMQETAAGLKGKTVRRLVRGTHAPPSQEKTRQIVEKARASTREADKRAAYRAIAQDAGLL